MNRSPGNTTSGSRNRIRANPSPRFRAVATVSAVPA